MTLGRIDFSDDAVRDYCRKWQIVEFSVFGSVLTDEFRPDSDVDVIVKFAPGGGITFENMLDMRDELSAIFGGREVDIVEKRALRNPFIRHHALTHRQVIYAA